MNATAFSRFSLSRRRLLRSLLIAPGIPALLPPAVRAEEGSGWRDLFNGKDLSGWRAEKAFPFWSAENGALVGRNDEKLTGSMLYTEEEFADFEFEAEAKWEGEIDSGFMFRNPELQVQLGVSRSLKRDMTASFYTGGAEKYPEAAQAKEISSLMRAGDWNLFKIRAEGDRFTVLVNGKAASAFTSNRYSGKGPIGLQIHGGLRMSVLFRNLRVRTLN